MGNVPNSAIVARACQELAEAQSAHFSPQQLLGDQQAELESNPLRQLDQPPANHALRCRNGAGSHLSSQCPLPGILRIGALPASLRDLSSSGPATL